MKVDRSVSEADLRDVGQLAAQSEDEGYDGLWTLEATRDPFIPLFLAAGHTRQIELATSIAVAFARSPMTVASVARDLQDFSAGRATIGLGPQIKAHIERRYSMPGDKPVARMREFVNAVRAIWECWDEGTPLDFRGEFYTHTLMPPLFRMSPSVHPSPPIVLAGVGPQMTSLAGEVADGFVAHSFTSQSYLRNVTVPRLQEARAKTGKSMEGFEMKAVVLVATGSTEQQFERSVAQVREWLAFYGSTPAYAPVLEHHNWGDLHLELLELSKNGGWKDMPSLIDDEVLNTLAFVGEPHEIGPKICARYDGLLDRVGFYRPEDYEPEVWAQVVASFR